MKIGIITFHFVSNQGGVLQSYASQVFFEKNGYDAWIIDYQPYYHTVRYSVHKNPFIYSRQYWKKFHKKSFIKRVMLTIRSFFRCFFLNLTRSDAKIKAEFNRFISKNLHLTRSYKSLKQIESNPPRFDAYITGSDQLWNPDILDYKYDSAYFLSFVDKDVPKVAYAVSTGKVLSSQEEYELKELCENLTAVSMREYNESTMKAIGKDVHICLDPTLLLEAEDYASVESDQIETAPYIFVYGFETNEEIKNAISQAVKKYGCKVINGSPGRIKLEGNYTNLNSYGPDRFLTLVKNAQCVVTNSFHGTSFSIIYKKDFIAVSHSTRGNRMNQLLGKLNLKYRLWGTEEFSFEKNVDWNQVYKKLNVLRMHSEEYLLSAVNGVFGEKIPHWDDNN